MPWRRPAVSLISEAHNSPPPQQTPLHPLFLTSPPTSFCSKFVPQTPTDDVGTLHTHSRNLSYVFKVLHKDQSRE